MDSRRTSLIDTILTTIVAVLVLATVWGFVSGDTDSLIPAVGITGLVVVGFALIRSSLSSDHRRAIQSNNTLKLASQTLEHMREGLSPESAQAVCELLLPNTGAGAVSITDTTEILGFCGLDEQEFQVGSQLKPNVTLRIIEEGQARMLSSRTELGLPEDTAHYLNAAIVEPLRVRTKVVGTLRFYYKNPRKLDESQRAMAQGLAQLLSTQLSLAELDAQTELATRMELKMLQAQINPHFLFNTINTIAALIRTEPDRARVLLREFAVFYRRVLENSMDLIPIEQEVEQTRRYLGFEQARFGDDRIFMEAHIVPGLEKIEVPSFVIQPLVENSVNHAMRDIGALRITIDIVSEGDDVVVRVSDDGVGIPAEKIPFTLKPGYGTGIGIALKNVDDRLKGYFGSASGIRIESEYGIGTTVFLTLQGANKA